MSRKRIHARIRKTYPRKPPADDHDTAITAQDINAIIDEVTHQLHQCPQLLAVAIPYINCHLLQSRAYWNQRRNYSVLDWLHEAVEMFDPPQEEREVIAKLTQYNREHYSQFLKVIQKHLSTTNRGNTNVT